MKPNEQILADFKPAFSAALDVRNLFMANRIALSAAERLFEQPSAEARKTAWKEFFHPLSQRSYRTQYQCFDFEVVDYDLQQFPGRPSLLRGPKPPPSELGKGSYFTLFGAAQLFGRYQKTAPHLAISHALGGVPVLNFSIGGAGPESFVLEEMTATANNGTAVVLQVLSGRSVGCDEYPGSRMTVSRESAGTKKVDRLELLTGIWNDSPTRAKELVSRWRTRYVQLFEQFVSRISVPVILVWISDRSPDDWHLDKLDDAPDFGSFPQLIGRETVEEIRECCSEFVEVSYDSGLPHGFISRFTKMECPIYRPDGSLQWINDYYPSACASARASAALAEALRIFL